MVITLLVIIGTLGTVELPKARASTVVNITLYGAGPGSGWGPGWGYNPDSIASPGPTITVNQGDTVNMTLISQDLANHEFYVDYDNDTMIDYNEPDSGLFNTEINLTFIADTNGTFTYYDYENPTTMFGTFIVTSTIPEFSSLMILPLLVVATLSGIAVSRRALSKKDRSTSASA